MAVIEIGGTEAAEGMAQEIAQGEQFVGGSGHGLVRANGKADGWEGGWMARRADNKGRTGEAEAL